MAEPGGRWRRGLWIAPGDGADHITGLPLELRARIASFLPFRQVVQLSSLSRPWRRIHYHTPVVRVKLSDFLFPTGEMLALDEEHAFAGLEAALLRRAEEPGSGSSKVKALEIRYSVHEPLMRHHADRIIALADARELRIEIFINGRRDSSAAWALDLPPSTRALDVVAFGHLAPTISGPGAAALENLGFHIGVVREWSRLPSLRILTLELVTVQAPFPLGACWPLLEDLSRSWTSPSSRRSWKRSSSVVAPELETLVVRCGRGHEDYRSFTLQAPRLRCLEWYNQFTERVDIDVGRPGSVTAGVIELVWNGGRDMKDRRALMMRMLKGLLPELPQEQLADAARPHITHDKYYKVHCHGELVLEEKITCDLDALMSPLQLASLNDLQNQVQN
ncbi:hypothetical protein PR202_gb26315 [Eleusine coracana subsp. coracana]|uniref:F-box domain-containing protein n=1 Tax=Eleusine coracana subsp. coracana TaxID=191504 RepID=A0AAV5FRJ7_ELECO|nr:hypothetical protein PR202_gb26315 [Eleusine coracana subsp. coracana]